MSEAITRELVLRCIQDARDFPYLIAVYTSTMQKIKTNRKLDDILTGDVFISKEEADFWLGI